MPASTSSAPDPSASRRSPLHASPMPDGTLTRDALTRPLVLAALVFGAALTASPGARSEGRVDNPFEGADRYRDLDWVARAQGEAARAPDRLARAMLATARHSPAIWIDGIEALEGSVAPRERPPRRGHR